MKRPHGIPAPAERRSHPAPSLRFLCALLVSATAVCAAPRTLAAPADATVQWRGVERVMVFADVHGAYTELHGLLRESGVIDAQDRWAAGRAHVVSLGDLLDRGADSRKVMDLLMRLQGEAHAAGGKLHVVLGNHEAMNLLGDLRYVDRGEYAAYVDLEPAGERARAREAWLEERGPAAAAEFDQAFPPGWFGHRAALAPNGPYGKWLLALPVAIAIDRTLYMHAGPSAVLRGMPLQELDVRYRTGLAEYLATLEPLRAAGLVVDSDPFRRRPELARERLAQRQAAGGPPIAPELLQAVDRFERADANPLLQPEGPNWYRGAALCNEASETDVLAPLLAQFGVTRVVLGHTPARDMRVGSRFDGRVIKLDTGMNVAVYRGHPALLTLQGDRLAVRYAGSAEPSVPQPEQLRVAPEAFDDSAVAQALAAGTVTVTGPRAPGELSVTVEHAGLRIPAVFVARSDAATRNEIAAYRLDRKLSLGIVPATVEREVQGQRGYLQARPEKWASQNDVQRQALKGSGWCALQPQFQLVYAFDALIGNEGRTGDSLLFDTDEWYAYVTAHEKAFGTGKGLPAYLAARPPAPGAELRRRLATLNEQVLASTLGDAVDARARKAILARRDVLLGLPAAAAAR
jgi:hypothetical protein